MYIDREPGLIVDLGRGHTNDLAPHCVTLHHVAPRCNGDPREHILLMFFCSRLYVLLSKKREK